MSPGDLFCRPSYPVPPVAEVVEVDEQYDLVTFKHKRKTHAWPIAKFRETFPYRVEKR